MARIERLQQNSGLGRTVDPRHPITRRVFIGATVVGVVTLGLSLATGGPDLRLAARAGMAAFLAWAIARELDPDRPRSADVAIVASLGMTFGGDPSLVSAAVMLLAVRVLAGTVGRRLAPVDGFVLIGTAALAGGSPVAWPGIVALALAIWWEGSLPVWYAIAVAGAGVGAAMVTQPEIVRTFGTLAGLLVVLSLLAAIPQVRTVEASPDSGVGSLEPERVRAARLVAAVGVAIGAVLTVEGVWAVGPIAAALVGTAVAGVAGGPSIGSDPADHG